MINALNEEIGNRIKAELNSKTNTDFLVFINYNIFRMRIGSELKNIYMKYVRDDKIKKVILGYYRSVNRRTKFVELEESLYPKFINKLTNPNLFNFDFTNKIPNGVSTIQTADELRVIHIQTNTFEHVFKYIYNTDKLLKLNYDITKTERVRLANEMDDYLYKAYFNTYTKYVLNKIRVKKAFTLNFWNIDDNFLPLFVNSIFLFNPLTDRKNQNLLKDTKFYEEATKFKVTYKDFEISYLSQYDFCKHLNVGYFMKLPPRFALNVLFGIYNMNFANSSRKIYILNSEQVNMENKISEETYRSLPSHLRDDYTETNALLSECMSYYKFIGTASYDSLYNKLRDIYAS